MKTNIKLFFAATLVALATSCTDLDVTPEAQFTEYPTGEAAIEAQMAAEIAAAGGGLYVRADNTNNALKYIQSELDKSAKGDVESKVYTDFDEQFQTIAWIVFVILIIEIFIRERKNKFLSKFKLF